MLPRFVTMPINKQHEKGLRMIEFFSGIGGMRLAVENALRHQQQQPAITVNDQAGNSPIHLERCQAYDISLHANKTYVRNFHDGKQSHVSTKLVEQLKPKDLDGKSDLWTMSPPCQPFTKTRGAKELDIEDKRCEGLKGIMRLLTEIQDKPKYIVLENVKGFSKSQMIEKWYECLESNDYSWKEYLISPIHLGIPNNRLRYYIICERQSSRWKKTERKIHQSFSDRPENSPMQSVANYVHTSLTTEELAEFIVPESKLEQNWAHQVGVVTGADTATHCFTAGYGRIFHSSTGSLLLMPSDGKEEEAVASKPLDRSNMLQYCGRLRRFTPKELLALFGFPLDYDFPSEMKLENQYKLIGNSINVIVVTELVKELLFRTKEGMAVSGTKEGMAVGGTKGHSPETIDGNLLHLYRSYRWKMIPNCTGRYTCREHELVSPLNPLAVLKRVGIEKIGNNSNCKPLKEFQFELPDRPDRIIVVPLDDHNLTGMITFVKEEGVSYAHTLNTPSGFRRKLEAIGIKVTECDVYLAENDNKIS